MQTQKLVNSVYTKIKSTKQFHIIILIKKKKLNIIFKLSVNKNIEVFILMIINMKLIMQKNAKSNTTTNKYENKITFKSNFNKI